MRQAAERTEKKVERMEKRMEETMVTKEMAFVIVDQAMGINFIDIII